MDCTINMRNARVVNVGSKNETVDEIVTTSDARLSANPEAEKLAFEAPVDRSLKQMQRRQFLVISAAVMGGVLLCGLDGSTQRVSSEDRLIRIPLHFFDPAEAAIVMAAASRISPADESGPGAKEAGVVVYIDRHLAGPYGSDGHRYTQPPFEDGVPELGYQGKATPAEIYREGLKGLAGFHLLPVAEQDKALTEIESTLFFTLLRQHTIEGMFCDPVHGGNVDMLGWQLLGFPGARMNNYDDVDKHFGEAFRPDPVSLGGHPRDSEG
jgi:gluconate 2-dehydrogenase gamma chain